jgi:hypothetical protein
MEPRREEKREPEKAPELPKEQPTPKRFRIVKLEERVAPRATIRACTIRNCP